MITELICTNCGHTFPPILLHACSECFGPLEVSYNWDLIQDQINPTILGKRNPSLWKYHELLPVKDGKNRIETRAGNTPLIRAKNLEKILGIDELYLKADYTNPTGSFKDRPATVAVAKAKEFGFNTIGCASTGNLASATAYAAIQADLNCVIIVPHKLDRNKIGLAQIYGGNVLEVSGTYDLANRYANLIADDYECGFVNVNLRPYYIEGSKTITYEVIEQLGWEVPDHIITPLGSGALYTTIDKAVADFAKLGWIDNNSVKISGSQPKGCNPIAQAYNEQGQIHPIQYPDTKIKSLAIGDPASGRQVLDLLHKNRGFADDPHDDEIFEAQILLAKSEGIFVEGAGGSVVASLIRKLKTEEISSDEKVVLFLTGIGYKTISSLVEHVTGPQVSLGSYTDLKEKVAEVISW